MTEGIQIGSVGDHLHLNHGPIDLLLHAEGTPGDVRTAYENAIRRFKTVLMELVQELPLLRRELPRDAACGKGRGEVRNGARNGTRNDVAPGQSPSGPIAQRMMRACLPLRSARLSPMAAVAGAVADYMLWVMNESADLQRAWVNNGGDIAFSLDRTQHFRCGLAPEVGNGEVKGDLCLVADDPARGIATSGWATREQGGRSFSLGIADAVTVVAKNAADADAAATLIANHVDLPGHNGIARMAARELDPDSDLGRRQVTTGVPSLTECECQQALERGAQYARNLHSREQIYFAVLYLQNTVTLVGNQHCLQLSTRRNPKHALDH